MQSSFGQPGRARATLAGILSAAILSLLWFAPVASAGQITLGFDDQPSGTVITTQYQSADGVEFGQFTGGAAGNAFTVNASSPSTLASSPPNVLDMAFCEFSVEFPECTTDNDIHFDLPQSSVSFKLGFDDPDAPSGQTVTVTAYDASGNTLATVSPTVGVGVHTPVTIAQTGGGAAKIAFLRFTAFDDDNWHELTAIDDLSFLSGTAGPQVGVSTTGESYLYTGSTPASTAQTIRVAGFAGSTGPVSLAVAGLPNGVSAKFATNPFTGGNGATDVLTPTAPAGTPGQPLANVSVTATPSPTAGTAPVSTTFPSRTSSTATAPRRSRSRWPRPPATARRPVRRAVRSSTTAYRWSRIVRRSCACSRTLWVFCSAAHRA